jgi:hypothetical protein
MKVNADVPVRVTLRTMLGVCRYRRRSSRNAPEAQSGFWSSFRRMVMALLVPDLTS